MKKRIAFENESCLNSFPAKVEQNKAALFCVKCEGGKRLLLVEVNVMIEVTPVQQAFTVFGPPLIPRSAWDI